MSKLEFFARPLVAFNPENKDHRRYYHQFIETNGWGHCPVRFICPEDVGMDLTMMIKNQLIQYYISKEFANKSTALEAVLRQKRQKTVDKRTK
jgi:hypothetical protein